MCTSYKSTKPLGLRELRRRPHTTITRWLGAATKRNTSKNAPKSPKKVDNTTNPNMINKMQSELSQINAATAIIPDIFTPDTVEDTTAHFSGKSRVDGVEITQDDIASIFGTKAKLVLPDIPLSGAQCFWGRKEDPMNPFTFPILDITPILSPTDISINIDPKDSDVSSNDIFQDFQRMVNGTLQQGGQVPHPDGRGGREEQEANLERSLHNIGDPTRINPLQQTGMTQKVLQQHAKAGTTGQQHQMATSKCNFNETILFTVPVRKSQLSQIQKVFKITASDTETEGETGRKNTTSTALADNNPLRNIVTLAKANETNKRFDIFLINNDDKQNEKTHTMATFGGGQPQSPEDEKLSTALIFSSNVSNQSLDATVKRLSTAQDEIATKLRAQGKTYTSPLLEHVCVERNYILELQKAPSLIPFPSQQEQTISAHDPIKHLLVFPVIGSTTTYATNEPLGQPSTNRAFRLAEAEFLLKSCLMGLNFPAPIDPAFKHLIQQDRMTNPHDNQPSLHKNKTISSIFLTPEESQKSREIIARAAVAMYGHGTGLAAEPWSVKEPIIKPDIYLHGDFVNYELEVTYSHNPLYNSLYALSLLPSQQDILAQLEAAKAQFKEFESELALHSDKNHQFEGILDLEKIRADIDSVFGQSGPHSEQKRDNDTNNVVADIEDQIHEKLALLEEQQLVFQQEMEDKLRVARIAKERQQETAKIKK